MKIGELEQHCGNCTIMSLCGEPYSDVCLCANSQLADIDEDAYKKMADSIRGAMGRISNEEIESTICLALATGD